MYRFPGLPNFLKTASGFKFSSESVLLVRSLGLVRGLFYLILC
jgi:hypothetical protein